MEWKSGIAKAKRILVNAGFPWSVTTGRYSPFGGTQKTTPGIRVTRIGCSESISVSAWGMTRRNRDASNWMEALAIATLRQAGMPFDDRGWLACGRDAQRAAKVQP